MLYTALTVKAMKIAYDAHNGQFDKGGVPYVFHPYHLAEQIQDEYTVCAALLHDVVEDTDITFEQLAEEFPEPIITALKLLTHDKDTDYFDYVRALKDNPIARAVKYADLAHNSDPQRCALVNDPTGRAESRMQKYAEAKRILTNE